jgi:eukaryotic-like serine/threonine-protein kinase
MVDVHPGQVLAGKYRVDRVLGQGGMGVVVAATHLHLDERVALKFLLPQAAKSDSVARFLREAKAAVRIRSEHVARVIDVGSLEDGAPYMVMEYLDGADLAHVVRDRQRLPFEEIVEYILQACEALAEAHSLGIVHRDLKPANLFLTKRIDGSPSLKVLDFGVSKLLNAGPAHDLTKTGGMLGSPLYMSPEQLMNAKDVDVRTDVWALGVIMYELATGVPPFTAEELPQLLVAIMQGHYAPIGTHRHDVPEAFEAAVRSCIAIDRNYRFSNIAALANALESVAPVRARRSLDVIRAIALPTASTTPMQTVPTPPPSMSTAPAERLGQAPSIAQTAAQTHAAFGGTAPGDPTVKPKSRALLVAAVIGAFLVVGAVAGAIAIRNDLADARHRAKAEQEAKTSDQPKAATPKAEPLPSSDELPSHPASASPSSPATASPSTNAAATKQTATKPATSASATTNQYDKAKQLMADGDLDAAEREARSAIATHGNAARLLLGEILERKGKPALARDIYKKVLEIDPSNGTAKTRMAKLGG